jgi:hypothetical protein
MHRSRMKEGGGPPDPLKRRPRLSSRAVIPKREAFGPGREEAPLPIASPWPVAQGSALQMEEARCRNSASRLPLTNSPLKEGL